MPLSALLFDLDNTLLLTDAVTQLRKSGNAAYLRLHLGSVQPIPGLASAIAGAQQVAKLGVVTKSPRWYAATLLDHFFPGITWDTIVAGSEAGRYKPYPDGINQALARLNISPAAAAYVGDNPEDIEAAYLAGVRPVLALFKRQAILRTYASSRPVWPLSPHSTATPIVSEDFTITPEFVLWRPADIPEFVQKPEAFLPLLESCHALNQIPNPYQVLPLSLSPNATGGPITGAAFARYFPRQGPLVHLHNCHPVSQEVVKKENPPYHFPQVWANSLAHYIGHMERQHQVDLVTVIPARPGKDPRLERFLDRVQQKAHSLGTHADFAPDVFEVSAAANTRSVNSAEKLAHVLDTTLLKRDVNDRRVLVIDDVVTTGATFTAASQLLARAGAARTCFVALTKTVSGASFTAHEQCTCPCCGRAMVKRRNRSNGNVFWGCTGYASGACDRTINIGHP